MARQQKRRTGRSPGVFMGPVRPADAERAAPEHGVRVQSGVSARILSAAIVLGLLMVISVFFLADFFYIRSVAVGGANYLDESEIFRYADIAEMHLFWVDPDAVRRNILEASPVIADARVVVGWPPGAVKIFVEERQPAVLWSQAGVPALVDIQGRVLRFPPPEEQHLDLIRVIAEPMIEGPPGLDVPIPVDAVTGALQLHEMVAGIQSLRFHPTKGLGFHEPGGWDVWLGVGTDMPNKMVIYETLRDDLQARGIVPVEINVSHPEAAYYCGGIELCYE